MKSQKKSENLVLPVKIHGRNKFLKMLRILNMYAPFNRLRGRELEVFAEFLYYYNVEFVSLELEKRNALIFTPEIFSDICERLGMKLTNIYNIIVNLKRAKVILIDEKSTRKFVNPKFSLHDLEQITFQFLKDEES